MKIITCLRCGYTKVTSLEYERTCKKCGGLLKIIAEEKPNDNNK